MGEWSSLSNKIHVKGRFDDYHVGIGTQDYKGGFVRGQVTGISEVMRDISYGLTGITGCSTIFLKTIRCLGSDPVLQ